MCTLMHVRAKCSWPGVQEEIISATSVPGEVGEGKEALWGVSGGFLESQDRHSGPGRAKPIPNRFSLRVGPRSKEELDKETGPLVSGLSLASVWKSTPTLRAHTLSGSWTYLVFGYDPWGPALLTSLQAWAVLAFHSSVKLDSTCAFMWLEWYLCSFFL